MDHAHPVSSSSAQPRNVRITIDSIPEEESSTDAAAPDAAANGGNGASSLTQNNSEKNLYTFSATAGTQFKKDLLNIKP